MKSMYEAGMRLLSSMSPWSTTEVSLNSTLPRDAARDMNLLSPRLLEAILDIDRYSTSEARDEEQQSWPVAYSATGSHERIGRNMLFPDSESLVVRRFGVSDTSHAFGQLFDNCRPSSRVLDFQLGGFELLWHGDLLNASERRTALLGRMQLHLPDDGIAELEHLVLPDANFERTCLLHGWFNLLSGSLPKDVPWRRVLSGRMRRAQPVRIEPRNWRKATLSGMCASSH